MPAERRGELRIRVAGANVELPAGSPSPGGGGAPPAAAFPPAGTLNPADPQAALLHAFLTTTAELRDRVWLFLDAYKQIARAVDNRRLCCTTCS